MTLQTTDGFADWVEPMDEAAVTALWARVRPAPLFSAIEERVIALAARDTLASLDPPGALDRLAALLFGRRAASRSLADPRLEALRHAVVVSRHRRHLPDAEAARLRGLGFDDAQLRAIESRAAGDHPNR